ncbi:P-loop NTPase fold protein [Streptomyces sp. NPDC127092]|uniref:P-loop NTPase fold protein n=1 Tax=Streptomyces sp. NPDC127092 TaxID=3347135 RepID=UPI003653AB38
MARQQRWAIEDIAIAQSDQDLFDHLAVAQQLSRTVREVRQSLAIGLLGPFGSGKSSIVRLLTSELAVNKDWAVLHVSAEHHSGVARARALMYALLDAAHHKKLIDEKTYASERACLEGTRQRALQRSDPEAGVPGRPKWRRYVRAALAGVLWVLAMLLGLWLLGVGAVATIHFLGSGQDVSAVTWFAPRGATSLTGILVSAAAVAAILAAGKEGALQSLKAYEITVSTPRPDTTDELEQAFTRLLQHVDRRLVIAVDDIDRLAASDVLDALATIRSFLLTGTQHRRPPVFLLSCDEDIVREAIVGVRPGGLAHRPTRPARVAAPTTTDGEAPTPVGPSRTNAEPEADTRKATEEAAQEYLNKLFTIRVNLPAHHDADLRDYAEQLLLGKTPAHPLVEEVGGLTPTRALLQVLIHRQVRDPRHVIRLLNSFCTDYQLAKRREEQVGGRLARIAPGEVTGHPLELARLTVLRHDFRELYDAISAENRMLHLLDDAILGSQEALADPLLDHYRTIGSGRRLDLDHFPGLAFLSATASRARTQRPFHIGPLINLGSSRASRLLGSQMAADIDNELVQRNGASLGERLLAGNQRARVLEAATASLGSARRGQDLDNAVAAVLEALGVSAAALTADPSEDEKQATYDLADCIVRQYDNLTLPLPSHLLVPLLSLTAPAHLPRLREELRPVPQATEEARLWAIALLALQPGEDSSVLASSLHLYFEKIATEGDRHELAFWEAESRVNSAGEWPPAAIGALLAMVARHEDGEASDHLVTLIADAGERLAGHSSVLLGLLECLSSSYAVRRDALRALALAPELTPEWGPGLEEADAPSLAAQLVGAVAMVLAEDEEYPSQAAAMDLLIGWLPAAERLPDAEYAMQSIADGAAAAAALHPELVTGAGKLLEQLDDALGARCVTAIAPHLHGHRSDDDAIGVALRTLLIGYLRRHEATNSEPVNQARRICLEALTADLETKSPIGQFARGGLPLILATAPGRELAGALAQRLFPAVPVNDPAHAQELLPTLQLLLQEQNARASFLLPALQHLQQFINHGNPAVSLEFAAHFIADPILDANWLNLFASHWPSLPSSTRSMAAAAAVRPDLTAIPALRDHLVQHLVETEETEPWRYADSLWSHTTEDQQGRLLARARSRCPALRDCAASSSAEVLSNSLVKAHDEVEELLPLIEQAPAFDEAVLLYLNHALEQPAWDASAAQQVITASSASHEIWDRVLSYMTEDQTSAIRGTDLMAALVENRPDTLPDDLVHRLKPVLMDAGAGLARAMGRALRTQHAIAKKLRRAMDGHSSSSTQRDRNAAFKEGSGT